MILKKIGPQELVCPHPGAVYMYISLIFKHLLWNHQADPSQILCEASIGWGSQCMNNPGHMTKMAAMPIYGKKPFKNWWLKYYNVSWPCGELDLFYDKVKIGRLCLWMGKTVEMSVEGKDLQEIGKWTGYWLLWKKWPQGFVCPFTGAIFHFIGIYNRSQMSVYRTIGPLVSLFNIPF